MTKKAKVCYILAYYSPNYIRTRTLTTALHQSTKLELYEARNRSPRFIRYAQALSRLIACRLTQNPDIYLLGFRGYEYFWAVRLMTWGKPLIVDHMMSPYDSLRHETKRLKPDTLLDKLVYFYEKSLLKTAQLILTDTSMHQQFLANLFDIPSTKIKPIPVAADEKLFQARHYPRPTEPFKLLFYGSFLPLHGVDIILQAAELLRHLPLTFTMIGGNRFDLSDFHATIEQKQLTNVFHVDWVEFEELPRLIEQADVGLGGPFGNTGQGQRVITGKTFQFLAMGKATIVGEIATDYGFRDKANCLLVPQGDAPALADAIEWSYEHRAMLPAIGQAGRWLYQQQFSISVIQKKLEAILS